MYTSVYKVQIFLMLSCAELECHYYIIITQCHIVITSSLHNVTLLLHYDVMFHYIMM